MKACFKCKQVLPLDAFYAHPKMADGRLGKCKECTKRDVIEHRLAKIEHYRQYDRMRASQPHRVQKAKEVQMSWKANNPKRRTAQVILGNAVTRGKIEKLPCLICGGKSEAHHPDYDRPLDVVWLCPAHHKQAHALVHNGQLRAA